MLSDKFDYPVRPTHTLQLDFNLGSHAQQDDGPAAGPRGHIAGSR